MEASGERQLKIKKRQICCADTHVHMNMYVHTYMHMKFSGIRTESLCVFSWFAEILSYFFPVAF